MKVKKKHHKHPPLKRPILGNYHQVEWAIYGTTCAEIESFYDAINQHFESKNRLSYIDADHSEEHKNTQLQIGKKMYAQSHVFEVNSFDDKFNVAFSQAVFINGNHYSGKRQIVIINSKKKESLQRRVDQLDQIDLVIVKDGENDIFNFVEEKMSEKTLVFRYDEQTEIFNFIEKEIKASIPTVKALILAGGKSTRMHEDKSKLKYHNGTTQEEYLAKMCKDLSLETYISKGANEEETEINDFQIIKDRYVDMGPFGAIMSAFLQDPTAAWLVLACDLPYFTEQFLKRLIDERSITHFATAYKIKDNPFPEPLMAIYEPAIYRRMFQFLSLGYACPRKVLINSEVKHVILEDEKIAFNANTQKDKEAVLNNLNTKV